MDSQKFLNVFREVLAPDTARVRAATVTLKSDFYPLPESLTVLLQLLFSHEPSPQRQLAATQAKPLVSKHWKNLPPEEKSRYRQQLLQGILDEEDQLIRHAAARVVTAVAKIDVENGEWLDIFDVLLRASGSSQVRQRQVGTFLLFSALESMGEEMKTRFGEMLSIFAKTIGTSSSSCSVLSNTLNANQFTDDPESAEARINTMLASSRLAIVLDTEEDKKSLKLLQDLIPQMVAVLKGAVDAGDEDRTAQSFEVFQTLLGCDAAVLNKHFGDLIQFMTQMAAEKSVDEDARTQALSFLMQCVRYRKLKVQALKVGEQLTKTCLEISTELGDSDADDEDVTTPRSALGLLDEMASSLPPSQVVVPLLHSLGPFVNSSDPNRRQGGLLALGMCVEGAPDFISTQMNEIMPLVLRLLEDEDLKVRSAALDAVMRISEDLPEDLAKEHEKLLPALVKHMDIAIKTATGLDDKKNLEIIRKSCHSIDSLVEGLEEGEIKQYLPELMPRMTRLLSHPDVKIKGPAIGAIGSIAAAAKTDFLPFFEQTMSELQEYVELKDSSDELDLRSVTCDAMGYIALAVGPKPFQQYVRPLMQATDEGLHLDHPKLKETSYLFWAMMAKLYKDDFKPFLEGVVKALFESLETEESDIEIDVGDEAEDLDGQEITIGGKKIKISALADEDNFIEASEIEDLNAEAAGSDDDDWDDLDVVSAVAQEKEIAIEAMGDVLTHCTRQYLPYMEKTIEAVLPMIEHNYEGVQKAAINTLFRAYAAVWDLQPGPDGEKKFKPGLPVKSPPSEQIRKLGEIIMTATLSIWQEGEDRAIVTDINRNLAATLRASGPSLVSEPTTLKPLTETLVALLNKTHACQKDFGDEEDLGQLGGETSEYDWLTIDTAMDAVAGLAIALGPTFAELYKIFEKPLLRFASGSEAIERNTSVGVLSECVRAMESAITPWTSSLLRLFLHRLSDEDPETKSNAAYGIGLLQEKSTSDTEILKAFPTILGKLEPLLQTQEARAKDNAAGCVSRMIMKHPDNVPMAQVVPALLDILPLRSDFDENEPVYETIIDLYSKNDSNIVPHTPRLLAVLAEVLTPEPEDQVTAGTREKIVQLVRYIASKGSQGKAEVGKYETLVEALSS